MKLYFPIINEEHSKKIQQELFQLGYNWAEEPKEVKMGCDFIVTGINHKSIHNSKKAKEIPVGHQICSLDDLIAHHEEFQQTKLSCYGLPVLINNYFHIVRICNHEITFQEIAELNNKINPNEYK